MQLVFAQSVRIFGNAVGQDLLPSGDLPEMSLNLGMRGDDDRRRIRLQMRLDGGGDAVEELDQFALAQLFRCFPEGLRVG